MCFLGLVDNYNRFCQENDIWCYISYIGTIPATIWFVMQCLINIAHSSWADDFLHDWIHNYNPLLKFTSFFIATISVVLPIVTIFAVSVFVILGTTTFVFIGVVICNFVPLRLPSQFSRSRWYRGNNGTYRLFMQLSEWIKHGIMDSNKYSNNNSFSNINSNVNYDYNYLSIDNDRLPLIRACCVNYSLNTGEKYFNPSKINNKFGNYFENNIDNCFENIKFQDIKTESGKYSNYRCINTKLIALVLKSFWDDIGGAAGKFDVMFDVVEDSLILALLYIFVAGLIFVGYFLSRIVWLVSLSILVVEQLITLIGTPRSKHIVIKYPHLIVFCLYCFIILIFGILFIKLIYFDMYYFKLISPFVNSFESFESAPRFPLFEFTKDYITDYFYPKLINNHESVFIIKNYCNTTLGGQGDVISNIIIKYLDISKDFQSIDSYIGYRLRKDKYDKKFKYKVLLVGITNSGKSTLFRQFCRCQRLFDVNSYDIVGDDEKKKEKDTDPRQVRIAITEQIIKDVQKIIKVMNQSAESDFDYNKIESSMERIANIDISISSRRGINMQTIHDIKSVWSNLFVDQETAFKWMAKCGVNDSTGMCFCECML